MIRIVERLIYPLFFLTVIAGLAYWYWTTTPTYSLTQIIGAVKNRDVDTFQKYVDVESITDRAIDDVLHGPARESGMFGNMDNMIGAGIIGLFKPEIAAIAKTQVLKFIESGALIKAIKEGKKAAQAGQIPTAVPAAGIPTTEPSNQASTTSSGESSSQLALSDNSMVGRYARKLKLGSSLKAYGLSGDGYKGIDYLKIEGQTALVGFRFHSNKFQRNIIIEIKMEENGGYWKVTELSNLNDLINTYLETRDKLESTAVPVNLRTLQISMRPIPIQ